MKRFYLVVVLLALASCAPPTDWADLSSVDELQDQFNRDRGNVRLVLIFSPT